MGGYHEFGIFLIDAEVLVDHIVLFLLMSSFLFI